VAPPMQPVTFFCRAIFSSILSVSYCSRALGLTTAVRVGVDYVTPSSAVRDLGIMIDSDVSMRSHVSRTVSGCFATLRQIRSIRRSVSVASRVAHHAASALRQRHARRSTGVSPPTTASAERRRQTDLPEKSVPARHTAPARA